MSLATCIGREQNVFNETFGHAHRVLFRRQSCSTPTSTSCWHWKVSTTVIR